MPVTSVTRLPEGFRLAGPSRRLDPRINAYRRDIADIDLADRLFAPYYARAEQCRCAAEAAMILAAPSSDAPAVSQLVHGEGFAVLDIVGGWAWGRCAHDGYVGYVAAAALGAVAAPSHVVHAPIALLFARPDIKAPVIGRWPIGARFAGAEADSFIETDAGFVHRRHAAPIGRIAPDPVAIAERMIGQPYLWGGRGGGGIDCSGLVQIALGLAGTPAPRDSDLQRALGRALGDKESLERGDLIFFPGHVGLMVDGEHMVHANAWWMAVTIEPLADIVARLAPDHARPILARRRIAA